MPEMDNRFMGPFTRMDAGGRLCRVTLTEIENSNDNSTPTPTISEGLDILRFQNLHERLAHRSPVAMRKTASEAGIEWPSAFDDVSSAVDPQSCHSVAGVTGGGCSAAGSWPGGAACGTGGGSGE